MKEDIEYICNYYFPWHHVVVGSSGILFVELKDNKDEILRENNMNYFIGPNVRNISLIDRLPAISN